VGFVPAAQINRKIFDLPQCPPIASRQTSRRIDLSELIVSNIDVGYLSTVIAAMVVFALTLGVVSFFAD